jgi:hypothetical protein
MHGIRDPRSAAEWGRRRSRLGVGRKLHQGVYVVLSDIDVCFQVAVVPLYVAESVTLDAAGPKRSFIALGRREA